MGRTSARKGRVSLLPSASKQVEYVFKRAKITEDSSSGADDDDDEDILYDINTDFSYGLIVGQCPKSLESQNSKRDDSGSPLGYLIYLARTPLEVTEDEDGVAVDEKPEEIKNLHEVDPEWVMEHAKRVDTMLPGGVRVVGMFVVDNENSSESVMKSNIVQTSLLKIDSSINVDKTSTQYFVLHVDAKNEAYACETFQFVDGNLSSHKPADIDETADSDFQWIRISSKFLFDCPIVFRSGDESEHPILDKVKVALNMVGKNLETSNILLDSKFRSNGDELLDESLTSGVPQDAEDDDEDDAIRVKDVAADILLDPEFQPAPDDVELMEISSRMRLSGRMCIRAFLHPRAMVSEAVEAVKEDLMRSLTARFDMHCDSLVGEEIIGAGDEVPVLHEPPRRVLITIPKSKLTISDFLFPGESSEASVKAVHEMFGFQPELEDLDDEHELVASPKQATSAEEEEKSAKLLGSVAKMDQISSNMSPVSIALSLVVAFAGVLLTYFFFTNENDEETLDAPFPEN